MMEKRAWCVVVGLGLALVIWRLSGCPGPPECYLPYINYQPLVASNLTSTPPPYPMHTLPGDDLSTLIDLRHFAFRKERSCNSSSPPLFVVLVHSAPHNDYNRRMIRQTWGREAPVYFMLGEPSDSVGSRLIDEESKRYGDIVQGSFLDSYRNMTYKHVMGLKWAAYRCPGAKYLLKTDDDVFVNTPFLHEFLNTELSPLGARRLLLCNVKPACLAKRTYRSKWRVSPQEYPGRWYPDYCPGWIILYSPDVAFTLYSAAQRSPYFWIDDVHITGTLVARTNLTHTPLGPLSLLEPETLELVSSRRTKTDFLFSLSSPEHFSHLWRMVTQPSSLSLA